MGADARWVCHSCKTVCCRGGRPALQPGIHVPSVKELDNRARTLFNAMAIFEVSNAEYLKSFVSDLMGWLSRHETHNIHVGSDYTTDMMDLDDYRNESVDGKVSDCTRYEARCKSVDEWRITGVRRIEEIIRSHGIKIGDRTPLAEELYDKFSMKEI